MASPRRNAKVSVGDPRDCGSRGGGPIGSGLAGAGFAGLGRHRDGRRGAVLLEFALVSLALYLVLAAMLGLGRWTVTVQSAQDAVRFAAREIALYPLPANHTFADALADPGFRQNVYDPDYLVVDVDAHPPGAALDQFFAGMPTVNRALRPLMIRSAIETGGGQRNILHIPGLVTDSASSPSGLTVLIPRVDARDPATGVELGITLVPVLEEVGPGSFSMQSAERGLVALRLQVPYQSATLSAYIPSADLTPQGEPFNQPIQAADPAGGGYRVVGPGPYSGTFGLGEHEALGRKLRPFRRLVSVQAMFRREVVL